MDNHRPMYTTNEVAELLNMRPQSVTNWRSRGRGPEWVRVGTKAIRYTHEAIDKFIQESSK